MNSNNLIVVIFFFQKDWASTIPRICCMFVKEKIVFLSNGLILFISWYVDISTLSSVPWNVKLILFFEHIIKIKREDLVFWNDSIFLKLNKSKINIFCHLRPEIYKIPSHMDHMCFNTCFIYWIFFKYLLRKKLNFITKCFKFYRFKDMSGSHY